MKLYHVIVVNDKTNAKTYMTKTPVTHAEACTILSKIPEPHERKLTSDMRKTLEESGEYRPTVMKRRKDFCPDCGQEGERKGHQTCQYPQD